MENKFLSRELPRGFWLWGKTLEFFHVDVEAKTTCTETARKDKSFDGDCLNGAVSPSLVRSSEASTSSCSSSSSPSSTCATACTPTTLSQLANSTDESSCRLPATYPTLAATAKTSPYTTASISVVSGVGGLYSPHSTVNGASTPSPPALYSPPSSDPLAPPAPGALPHTAPSRDTHRQVAKVRRFLTTLQQFASEINSDAGEKVRGLTLNLMSGLITVEEFHLALQEVTHFPLRPFVLPFLRSHIPLLTRDLRRHATRHGMAVQQYVAVQEAALLEAAAAAAAAPAEPGVDFFSQDPSSSMTSSAPPAPLTGAHKRKHYNSSYFENSERSLGTDRGSISPPPAKRLGLFSPPFSAMGVTSPDPPSVLTSTQPSTATSTSTTSTASSSAINGVNDDEWKNIHMMLNCILSMVEKTRRALTILQQREDGTGGSTGGPSRGACAPPADGLRCGRASEYDAEVRRHASELVAQAIRATEDRVAEVKRKAEEAVSEVRRAAVTEVQRAVAAAETRAQELVAAERARLETLVRELGRRELGPTEHRPDPHQDPHQVLGCVRTPTRYWDVSGSPPGTGMCQDSHQACWNCGRKAHETCSGCNTARYCGPFCQHKDWDAHHKVCSPSLAVANPMPSTNSTNNNNNNSSSVNNNNTTSSSATTNGGPLLIPPTVSHNGHHPVAPKLATVTHKLLAKAAEITKME
ncbi:Zinc finger MYND-type [Trinorchestia longiramus]|nr:Zinc finger MYND-type [Trinorchestia longiramus]